MNTKKNTNMITKKDINIKLNFWKKEIKTKYIPALNKRNQRAGQNLVDTLKHLWYLVYEFQQIIKHQISNLLWSEYEIRKC